MTYLLDDEEPVVRIIAPNPATLPRRRPLHVLLPAASALGMSALALMCWLAWG
jgi:hypothetical protein